MSSVHPALVLLGVVALVVLTRERVQRVVLVAGSMVVFALAAQAEIGSAWTYSLGAADLGLRLDLQPFRVDTLSYLFGLIFSLITVIGVVYALDMGRWTEHAATLTYAAGSLGVVYAGDWLTAFVFWEVMSIASLFVIWHGATRRSEAAGFRYLFVHLFGGALFLTGLWLHIGGGGSLTIGSLVSEGATSTWAYWLILVGVAVNAAIPPLHAWLTDAYPEASVSGMVFLSAFTTKTAVYVLLRAFPGSSVLVWAGVVMALYGVVYAILENDIRRLLGYHIVSQVGYMVAGIGMGTALALDGTAAHAFCHILYKALLLMGAGAVIASTGRRNLTDLGGIWKRMPVVTVLYMVGAFSISGVPLFNGFISKSMIVSAASEAEFTSVELLLTLASIGTFLHTGLKLPYFMLFGPDRGIETHPLPQNKIIAMTMAAICCVGLGLFPALLYGRLVFQAIDYHPYTTDHVVASLQLLVGTGIGFWLLAGKLGGQATISLDTDWLYRKMTPPVFAFAVLGVNGAGRWLEHRGARFVNAALRVSANPYRLLGLSRDLSAGVRGEPFDANYYRFPIGVSVFWALTGLILLALVLW
ncbi:MAG: Na(+)/H(+) antiporter subunit D [Vicinamibacterales bacterium]